MAIAGELELCRWRLDRRELGDLERKEERRGKQTGARPRRMAIERERERERESRREKRDVKTE